MDAVGAGEVGDLDEEGGFVEAEGEVTWEGDGPVGY